MRSLGIIKIGTSNTGVLAATDLTAPIVRRGRLVDLQDPETWNTLTQTLIDYTTILKDHGVQYGLVSGGEVVRQNRTLCQRIRELGLPLWLVSQDLEGRLTWAAVKTELPDVSTIIDVGGGSTEVVTDRLMYALPVGAAQSPHQTTWPRLDLPRGTVALVGGTAFALELMSGESHVSRTHLESLLTAILDGPTPAALLRLHATRQKLVVGGSRIIKSLLPMLGAQEFKFAHRGFMEGLWLAASLGRARFL